MSAESIAAALHLAPAGRGCWRGPCPCCGGTRRFQLRTGERAPLLWCFGGCRQEDVLAELRRRGLLESRELTPEQRRQWAEEKRKREEARAFAGAARWLADCALERMNHIDDRRADLVALQQRLRIDPTGEYEWWSAHHPALAAALLAAWRKQQRRLRAKTWGLVRWAQEAGNDG